MPAIKSNTVEWIKEGVASILGNKGGLERGIKKAMTKASRETRLETLKAVRAAGKHGKEAIQAAQDTGIEVLKNIPTAAPKSAVEGIGATRGIASLINNGEELTEESIKAASKSATNRIKRQGVVNAVKDYYADPFKQMGDKTLSDAERSLATKQFVGRVGATATAASVGIGVTHDLFSNNEEDTGLGGIAVNTTAVGGLATAGALGVSLLRKL